MANLAVKSISSVESLEDKLNKALSPLGVSVVPFDDFIKSQQEESKIKFIVTKGDEKEEFKSWNELEDWAYDEFYDYLRDGYIQCQRDGARFTDMREWLDYQDRSEVKEALSENDWKLEEL